MDGDGRVVVNTGPFIKNLLHNHSVIYKINNFLFPAKQKTA